MVADSDTRMNQRSPIPGVIIGIAADSTRLLILTPENQLAQVQFLNS